MALSNVRSRYVMANGVKTHYSESGDDGVAHSLQMARRV